MSELYLFKVSLKTKGAPISYAASKKKPIYLVASGKDSAEKIAQERIKSDLEVVSVSKMARQLAPHIFSAS